MDQIGIRPSLNDYLSMHSLLLFFIGDGDQVQDQMEANTQGQEEEEAQVLDTQGVGSPPQRLTRSQFKALGNNGRLFSLFVISLFEGA